MSLLNCNMNIERFRRLDMALYNKKEPVRKTGFYKLTNMEPKENFMIELENLLSDYENSLDSLTTGKTKEIFSKYSIKESKEYILERTELESRFIKNCITKMRITDEDMRIIKRINDLLFLSPGTITTEIDNLASPYYTARIEEYLRDGSISQKEKMDLDMLRQNLRLSDSVAKDLYRKAVKSQIDNYTKPIFDSEIFSPEDERMMYEAAGRLGINLKFPADVQEKLAKYRQNWELLNGELPVLQSDILLQSNEVLHYRIPIDWFEEKSITKRVNYSGFTYSTKLIGNLRWKVGTIQPHKITSQELTKIDSGILYLTNKRFIFNGQHGNKTVFLNKILGFTPYTDGMLIEKDSGHAPFFACDCDMQQFATILDRLLASL